MERQDGPIAEGLRRAVSIDDGSAVLFVFEAGSLLPFTIRRVFTVHASESAVRGSHAHKACSQAMVCLAGSCEVIVDDGTSRRTWHLESPADVLVVPPLHWCEQRYADCGTILMVFCDMPFEEGDYLRDYEQFRTYRRSVTETKSDVSS